MADSTENTNSTAVDDESDYDWESYKKKYEKSYSAEEDARRKKIFEEKVIEIKKINALYAEGKVTYQAGVNHLTDQTSDEMAKRCGLRRKD